MFSRNFYDAEATLQKRIQHRFSPVNFVKFLTKVFLQSTDNFIWRCKNYLIITVSLKNVKIDFTGTTQYKKKVYALWT